MSLGIMPLTDDYELNVAVLDEWLVKKGRGSQTFLARSVGAGPATICRARKERLLPTGQMLFRMAEVTGIPVAKLAVRVPRKKTA